MCWRTVWLSACSALVLAAGCGGGGETAMPADAAEALAAQSDAVADALAGGDPCEADRLADELVRQAEAAAVPDTHRGPLLDAAYSLADSVECPPPAPAPDEVPGEEEPPADDDDDDDDDNSGEGNGDDDDDDDDD